MCRCNEESVDHLLLHCPAAFDLWCFVFQSFGYPLGMVIDLLFGWWNWFGKHSLDVWNLVPLCLMWTVWRDCNGRTFKAKPQGISCLHRLLACCFTSRKSTMEFMVIFMYIILFSFLYSFVSIVCT
jgi:hypothetical protein